MCLRIDMFFSDWFFTRLSSLACKAHRLFLWWLVRGWLLGQQLCCVGACRLRACACMCAAYVSGRCGMERVRQCSC